jgi:class 3 adenylate cyclase
VRHHGRRSAVASTIVLQGPRVDIRVGINTGQVVMTGAADGTLLAGDAVNVAARLEQAVGTGEILIGAETHQLVRDAVLVDRLDPLAVKGKSEALSVFRVQKVDPAAGVVTHSCRASLAGNSRGSSRRSRFRSDGS